MNQSFPQTSPFVAIKFDPKKEPSTLPVSQVHQVKSSAFNEHHFPSELSQSHFDGRMVALRAPS